MAIPWNQDQLERVLAKIALHPVVSGQCLELGRALLPIGRERDAGARGLIVRANAAQVRYPCIEPAVSEGLWWFYHVTVEVDRHCVDALTGAPGVMRARYFSAHFRNEPDELLIDESDPNLEDECL